MKRKKLGLILFSITAAALCAVGITACTPTPDQGEDNPPAHTHSWSSAYTEDGDRHYQTCGGCNEKQYAQHSYNSDGVCICGKQKPTQGEDDPPAHKHSWSSAYTEDGDRHYQTCGGCNEKQYAQHSYYSDGVCVCGKQKPPQCEDNPPAHTHSWSSAYTEDGDRHYQTCGDCDEKQYAQHSYNSDGVCVCGKQKPPQGEDNPPAHTHVYDRQVQEQKYLKSAATCTTKAVYYISCECGKKGAETFESNELAAHNYVTGVCTVCGSKQPTKGLIYKIDNNNNTAYVAGKGTASKADIVISDQYNGYPVTKIGDSAFSGCNYLLRITIPNGVTTIGSSAFRGCSGLRSINIPDSVTEIGEYAFSGCSGIIQTDNGVKYVDNWIIDCDTSITKVTLRSGADIAYDAFNGCSNLKSVYYTGDIAGWCKVSGLSNLMKYGSSKKNLYINGQEITGKLVIPDGVTTIGDSAFYNCKSLTSINIPDSVTSIGRETFYNCSGLTNITISNRVTTIGENAFNSCSGLTSITIPIGVTTIGDFAFRYCSSLTEVHITDLAKWCNISFGNSYANPLYYAHKLYLNGELITDLVIPDSLTTIGSSAFSGCSSLRSITIPDNVTSIGDYAFGQCTGVKSITIGNGVTSIGEYAFAECKSLTSITIPNNVTNIGKGAFQTCRGLTSITIPDSVTSIGWNAFSGCSGLTSITIPDGVTSIGNYAFSGCTSLTSITIPDSVTNIGNYAFNNCSGLTSFTIPESVTSIGREAFYGCNGVIQTENGVQYVDKWIVDCDTSVTKVTLRSDTKGIASSTFYNYKSLTSIIISDSVTTIGDFAFYNCKSLTSIFIPNGVTSIGESAFAYCSGLTSITIGNGVTSIGDNAFYDCNSLTSIYYKGDIASWCGINGLGNLMSSKALYINNQKITGKLIIPNSVTSIGSSAFKGCYELTSITIPDSVTSIGDHAFSGCSMLTSITIPDGVTSIGSGAFSGCSRLTSITIPDSVTSIGGYAFHKCIDLTSITIGNSVTSIGDCAFWGCSGLTNITFNGTVEQWNAITKGSEWNYDTGEYTVTCTDGKLDKKGNVVTA